MAPVVSDSEQPAPGAPPDALAASVGMLLSQNANIGQRLSLTVCA